MNISIVFFIGFMLGILLATSVLFYKYIKELKLELDSFKDSVEIVEEEQIPNELIENSPLFDENLNKDGLDYSNCDVYNVQG
jgi:hypothetical protein